MYKIGKNLVILLALVMACGMVVRGAEGQTASSSPLRVCVLDFTSIDTQGQKAYLSADNRKIVIPAQSTLTEADRGSINGIMQGFVRMIDAWDSSKTNNANRSTQVDDNEFDRARALELYKTVVNGQHRPMVIGAEYLSAYLGRYPQVFGCVEPSLVQSAMQKLQRQKDFPKDFMAKLAQSTNATHLIYGTVSDLRSNTTVFKGYGVETRGTTYQLDVIIKLVDLVAQRTVYSNVYTGSHREQQTANVTQIDNNVFQNLMKAALQQAAEDLSEQCKPGNRNGIGVVVPVKSEPKAEVKEQK